MFDVLAVAPLFDRFQRTSIYESNGIVLNFDMIGNDRKMGANMNGTYLGSYSVKYRELLVDGSD